ncbi:MAG: VWA domain-containing protein [Proteobacteria bacterium]|nr:VWA domain-containing protein [Pseudomonadota bacterium]
MVNLTLKFVSCCRAADLRISTAEVLDCVSQLSLVNPLEEDEFKLVLRSNFAKSRREQSRFDQMYHLFFHEMKSDLSQVSQSPETEQIKNFLDQLMENDTLDTLEKALADFLAGKPMAYIQEVHKIHTQEEQEARALKSNMSQLASRLQVMLKINQIKSKVLRFLGDNHAAVDEALKKKITGDLNDRLDHAMGLLNNEPRPDNYGLKEVKNHETHYNHIGEIPFASLGQEEIEEVRDVIRKLVKKLEEIATLRYSVSSRGVIDIKKTLRKSGKYLGVPMEIIFKDRPLRKGKIVALCDVSGSVWSTARFMLNILYSLQECFSKVKSYIFVSDLMDVTDFFKDHDVNNAVEKIMKDTHINYYAPTDYGMAFQHFKNRHIQELDKKTTLLIIGDARSNHMNPQDLVLKRMRERCRRVIWLNPEQEKFWGSGDSEMYTYKAHCHEVRPCGNLNQLIDFIEELIL